MDAAPGFTETAGALDVKSGFAETAGALDVKPGFAEATGLMAGGFGTTVEEGGTGPMEGTMLSTGAAVITCTRQEREYDFWFFRTIRQMIFVFPGFTARTSPFSVTRAIFLFFVENVTFRIARDFLFLMVSFFFRPTFRVSLVLFSFGFAAASAGKAAIVMTRDAVSR